LRWRRASVLKALEASHKAVVHGLPFLTVSAWYTTTVSRVTASSIVRFESGFAITVERVLRATSISPTGQRVGPLGAPKRLLLQTRRAWDSLVRATLEAAGYDVKFAVDD
jgi:hypothetical protein